MDVVLMMHEIHFVADPVVGESPLPDFALPTDDSTEFMRIGAFNQLNSPFNGHIHGRRQQKMHMLGHQNQCMQFVASFAAMAIKSFQKHPDVRFDHEESAAVPSHKSDEISSRRGDESRRLQSKPQRLKAASVSELKLARVELVPFPAFFRVVIFVLGKSVGSFRARHKSRIYRRIGKGTNSFVPLMGN